MSDGRNEARVRRAIEIYDDFRSLKVQTGLITSRAKGLPPDVYDLKGFAGLRDVGAKADALFSREVTSVDTRDIPNTEEFKARVRSLTLQYSALRWKAHQLYLKVSAYHLWTQLREQAIEKDKTKKIMPEIDERLQQELERITDEFVVEDLRATDLQKNCWLEEEPSLNRIHFWLRRNNMASG